MNTHRSASTDESPLSDTPRVASIAAAVGALLGALLGAAIGYVIAGSVGALIGAVIGAIIGGLMAWGGARGREDNRGRAEESAPRELQAVGKRPSAMPVGGTSRGETDASLLVQRSEEAARSTPSRRVWDRADRSDAVVNVPLAAEHLEVDKRELDAGLVRLRKVVKTEVVHVPVELRREEIVVERVDPGAASSSDVSETSQPIEPPANEDVVIRLVKEEPVVQKEVKVFREVHVHRVVHTETQNIQETVRHEEMTGDGRGAT